MPSKGSRSGDMVCGAFSDEKAPAHAFHICNRKPHDNSVRHRCSDIKCGYEW